MEDKWRISGTETFGIEFHPENFFRAPLSKRSVEKIKKKKSMNSSIEIFL